MTKPRVISKAAIRRAKRQRIYYLTDVEGSVRCGVPYSMRTGGWGDSVHRHTLLPIGRGGNRNPVIDWFAVGWADYMDFVEYERYA